MSTCLYKVYIINKSFVFTPIDGPVTVGVALITFVLSYKSLWSPHVHGLWNWWAETNFDISFKTISLAPFVDISHCLGSFLETYSCSLRLHCSEMSSAYFGRFCLRYNLQRLEKEDAIEDVIERVPTTTDMSLIITKFMTNLANIFSRTIATRKAFLSSFWFCWCPRKVWLGSCMFHALSGILPESRRTRCFCSWFGWFVVQ